MKILKETIKIMLAVMSLLLTACSTPTYIEGYNYSINLDSSFSDATIELNVVGLNASEKLRYENMSISEYWNPGNPIRQSAIPQKLTFQFPSKTSAFLSDKNFIWSSWFKRDAEYIVFIADIPGVYSDKAGNADPRRLILPLDKRLWGEKLENVPTITIEVGPNGIISIPSL